MEQENSVSDVFNGLCDVIELSSVCQEHIVGQLNGPLVDIRNNREERIIGLIPSPVCLCIVDFLPEERLPEAGEPVERWVAVIRGNTVFVELPLEAFLCDVFKLRRVKNEWIYVCLLYTSPSPRDRS